MRWTIAFSVFALAFAAAGPISAPHAQTAQPDAERTGGDKTNIVDFLGRAVRAADRSKAMLALALERAENPAVKRFAETVQSDIANTVKRLQEIAGRNAETANKPLAETGAVAEYSTEAMATKSPQYQRLKSLHGAAFDRQFMSGMVLGYENAIRSFEAEAKSADEATRNFTTDALPRLRDRLAEAKSILAGLSGENR
jgi:predicted outer membrane protein